MQSQGRTFFNSLKAFDFLKYNFKVFPVCIKRFEKWQSHNSQDFQLLMFSRQTYKITLWSGEDFHYQQFPLNPSCVVKYGNYNIVVQWRKWLKIKHIFAEFLTVLLRIYASVFRHVSYLATMRKTLFLNTWRIVVKQEWWIAPAGPPTPTTQLCHNVIQHKGLDSYFLVLLLFSQFHLSFFCWMLAQNWSLLKQ